MSLHDQERSSARVDEQSHAKSSSKKDILSVQERVKLLEDQIKQKNDEYLKLTDVIEKLKIINTLLYKEVCKEYNTLSIPVEDE
ncbi:hypothetical protein NEAUS04_0995 [Nematocida ausubeli]|uniref:Uncharacterized protein n=1 Tax=Nematocida ausubeli (strain ATCC PRA-371 / ERTm2) TaxID=1913371 RepID=H8ZE88_NEMA1|nr:uncharacterized protein NESG_01748 [Nematocida ausubeli]EHY64853.1 hypothetical protein NERG_01909 [Nematocida ausubeli]KAI5132801.1 hypothetical protein NEAUS06_0347 [Nematocida ausubeli]KAI5135490.1 hypothetical protein NEAUS07_1184 [Nematocida ausubeli]KAI5148259.1 hypothetical protein NEAUS05_1316 [Nematocida ausubeli]KAI5161015.1 hypothetical protein NEAUS03_1464 [Nematocida ausubeli]